MRATLKGWLNLIIRTGGSEVRIHLSGKVVVRLLDKSSEMNVN